MPKMPSLIRGRVQNIRFLKGNNGRNITVSIRGDRYSSCSVRRRRFPTPTGQHVGLERGRSPLYRLRCNVTFYYPLVSKAIEVLLQIRVVD